MDTTLPLHFNLTGQVEVQGYMPDFTGNYSCVWRGLLRGTVVAVKIIQATGEPEAMKRKVLRERVVWGSVDHPNIYPFYGYDDNPAFGPFGALVSPWSANGDARRFLNENGERMILADRIRLWKGALDGVIYLHYQVPPIIHGDLKPGNVLIDDSGVPKICDFGLARIFLEQGSTGLTTTSEHTGTVRYLAPELVASDTTVYPTLASDVYALGCLGLDFVYLQQPFSNRHNNSRGQIFYDLRRGLPPAAEKPQLAWPSLQIWSILVQCWNHGPHSRPSAFGVAHMLRRTTLTFPTIVVKRIMHFVDVMWGIPAPAYPSQLAWEQRCLCLRHLCLVSRAYRECVTPLLYRDIGLALNDGRPLSALMSVLESSITKSPLFTLEAAGYGNYTQLISLDIGPNAMRQSDVAVAVRNLTRILPGLRLIHIHFNVTSVPLVVLPSLATLALERIDLALLFDNRPTLQALESLQRLEIRSCSDSASSSRPLREQLPAIYLPNLLEIMFHESVLFANTKPFATIATWKMPRLRSLDIRVEPVSNLVLLDFHKVLHTYGPQLQNLRLKRISLQAQGVSNLLAVCTDLRSLDIDEHSSLFAFSASHAHLEKIKVKHWPAQSSMYERPMDIAHALKTFKLKAEKSFPKLIEAELIVTAFPRPDLTGSFRTGDTFINFRNGSETYRLVDGGEVPFGAYLAKRLMVLTALPSPTSLEVT